MLVLQTTNAARPWAYCVVLASLFFSVGLVAHRAHAVPEELRGGVELGAAYATRSNVSPTLGARLGYGLADNLELQVEATGAWLQTDQRAISTQLLPALAYRFDVVRWVPFVRVGAGPLVTWEKNVEVGGLASGGVGLEYLWDRSLAVNLAYQADFLVLRREEALPLLPHHRLMFGVMWSSGW